MLYYCLILFIIIYYLYFLYKKSKRKIIISIEGNIGSGKSTLVKILEKNYKNYKNIHFLQEPVNIWSNLKNSAGIDILTLFYQDKNRWGYIFQNMAFITRLMQLENILKDNSYNIIITERSIHTDSNVFRKMLYHDDFIDSLENDLYELWFNHFKMDGHYFIYLDTSVDNCHDRIIKRNRKGEDLINKSYLVSLDTYHKNWLKNYEDLLVLNGNIDFHQDPKILHQFMDKINNFIKNIKNK